MIINNNELKFAEKVILIDAVYINKVAAIRLLPSANTLFFTINFEFVPDAFQ